MENFKEFITSITASIAAGLKPSDRERIKIWREKFQRSIHENQDRLEGVRRSISEQEEVLRVKKVKFDEARGLNKKLYAKELQKDLRKLGRLENPATFLLSSIEANELALERIVDLENALVRGVSETELDSISVQLNDALERVQEAGDALAELREIKTKDAAVEPAEPLDTGLESVMSSKTEDQGILSAEDLKALKQLEGDEDA